MSRMNRTTPDPSTDELLRDASQGDTAAAEKLFERHRERLLRMVSARLDERLAARLDASDVVQETVLEANRKLKAYIKEKPLPFYAWLRQIAAERLEKTHRRHIKAQKRSINREVPQDLPISQHSSRVLARQLSAVGSTPSQQVMQREREALVRRAIDTLSNIDREILALRHLEQLSISEIAAILGISETAAKSRHFRALGRLQKLLSETEDREP